MQQMIFIADLIAHSTCFGHHYAHHQELENIMLPVEFGALVFKLCHNPQLHTILTT